MNFLCDLHVPSIVGQYLTHYGHNCTYLSELNLSNTDEAIRVYADKNNLTLITKDGSFVDDKALLGSPKSYIIINLLSQDYNEILEALEDELSKVNA